MADDRLIVALDVPNALAGEQLATKIGDAVSFYLSLIHISEPTRPTT